MTNTINIDENTVEGLRAQWDALRGGEFSLDFERAVFLYNVLVDNLHEEEDLLRKFIVKVLGEYAGKRTEMFMRMTMALDVNENEEQWLKIGGKAMVLLARVDGRKHRRIWTAVNQVLADTGRASLSGATFRSILKAVLGADAYRSILTEKQEKMRPLTDYRTQVVQFQGQIFDLLDIPGVRDALSEKTRFLLGMPTLAEERRERRRGGQAA